MTDTNPNNAGTITIAVQLQENGQYVCQLSPALSDQSSHHIRCYGQNKEHAIAIALEQLAEQYRQIAEEQQNSDWQTVERSENGDPILKRYHVLVHYERITEDESKFEAMHNTIIGNTVVENAKITVIEIDADLPVEPLERSWY